MSYEWVRALHIISLICWFAALFYLPRLFVYHAQSNDSISLERFKIMERKLYRGIATPSMVMTLGFGFWLVSFNPEQFSSQAWFHAKMTFVVLLVAYHFICHYFLGQFKAETNTRGHVFFRWFNEVPVLLLIGAVIMVVVKPF